MSYNRAEGRDLTDEATASTVGYFIGSDKQPTIDPNRHVHVIDKEQIIHDEIERSVILVITDRTWSANRKDQHLFTVEIPDDPPGNVVNQAISALVDIMNMIPRGPREEPWP